jgi:hypothetical protein
MQYPPDGNMPSYLISAASSSPLWAMTIADFSLTSFAFSLFGSIVLLILGQVAQSLARVYLIPYLEKRRGDGKGKAGTDGQ